MVSWPEGSPYPSASPGCQGGAVSACPSSCRPASRCGPGSRPLPFPRASVPRHARRGGSCPGHSPWGPGSLPEASCSTPQLWSARAWTWAYGRWGRGARPAATSRGRGAARQMLSAARHVLAIGRCQPPAQCLRSRSPLEATATPVHMAATEPPVCVPGGRLLPGSVVSCRSPGGAPVP